MSENPYIDCSYCAGHGKVCALGGEQLRCSECRGLGFMPKSVSTNIPILIKKKRKKKIKPEQVTEQVLHG